MFAMMAERPETEFHVSVSYMEIYNERMYDLLDTGASAPAQLAIAEDAAHGVYVRGLRQVEAPTEEDALRALFAGEARRTTAEHMLNMQSNRSHCIFTVMLAQRSRVHADAHTINSKLYLVDLAGSERLKKTQVYSGVGTPQEEALRKESQFINKSLAYLEQCVVALNKRVPHVPYRQSKLTAVLRDALGGNCRAVLIACIWGEVGHLEETVSTLWLAARVGNVTNKLADANVTTDLAQLVRSQQRTIKLLQQELQMHDALADRRGVVYSDYTSAQQAELAEQLQSYFDATTAEEEDAALQLQNVRQMYELLRQAKIMVRKLQAGAADAWHAGSAQGTAAAQGSQGSVAGAGAGHTSGHAGGDSPDAEAGAAGVGKLDPASGLGIGLADPHARPASHATGRLSALSATSPGRTTRASGVGESKLADSFADAEARGDGNVPASVNLHDRNAMFTWYRSEEGPGYELSQELAAQKRALKDAKAEVRECASTVNAAKADIDEAQARVAAVRETRGGASRAAEVDAQGQPIVDQEEYDLLHELKQTKRVYRAAYDQLSAAKSRAAMMADHVQRTNATLVSEFEVYWTGATGQPSLGYSMPASVHESFAGHHTRGSAGAASPDGSPARGSLSASRISVFSASHSRNASPARRQEASLSSAAASAAATAALINTGVLAASAQMRGVAGTAAARRTGPGDHAVLRDPRTGDVLDDAEAFEKLKLQRIVSADPDSAPYYAALTSAQRAPRRIGASPTRRL